MSAKSGTIFLQRTRRTAVMGVIASMAEAIQSGAVVGVFPEGTCTDGTVLLPFHANLIQAAINAKAKVVPATLRYRHSDGRIALAAGFVGDMTLVDTAKAMIRARPLTVELLLHPAIDVSGLTRHEVAARARQPMLEGLGIEP
jgi:1-acyl-sn-glycerol-3-phosphate acyltransferase